MVSIRIVAGYVRGFSAGKSDAINLQRPLVKPKIEQLFLYIVAVAQALF